MREELLRLHRADIGPEEEAEVLEVLRGGWLTKGPRTTEFQQRFALRVGAPQALGLNSCTAALHTALLAAGIGPGDEVIVPALTFAATANVVVHCGARPVFADVLEETHCIDPAHCAQLITPRTRAVLPVHFGGIPCRMDEIYVLAQQHGLFVLDDCAHAIETQWRNKPVGIASGSRFAAYSFYATKNLITGEGGMLCCRDEADLTAAQVLSLHGMSAGAWQRYSGSGFKLYDIVAAGFKYNMFDLQAALGLVQLAKLDSNWQRRRDLAERYAARLAGAPDLSIPGCPPEGRSAHHLQIVRLAEDNGPAPLQEHRDSLIRALRERNIETYVHYICLTGTSFYRERYGTDPAQTPVAASLAERSISLPLFPGMEMQDVDYVCNELVKCLQQIG